MSLVLLPRPSGHHDPLSHARSSLRSPPPRLRSFPFQKPDSWTSRPDTVQTPVLSPACGSCPGVPASSLRHSSLHGSRCRVGGTDLPCPGHTVPPKGTYRRSGAAEHGRPSRRTPLTTDTPHHGRPSPRTRGQERSEDNLKSSCFNSMRVLSKRLMSLRVCRLLACKIRDFLHYG